MQQKENPLQAKSYAFSLEILEVYKNLLAQKEFILSKQLVRSGTSIGANIEESLQAQSKKDFIAKLSISLKEAHECRYWIRLLRDGKWLDIQAAKQLLPKIEELIKLLTAIIKTSKRALERKVDA
ncbi:MAG: four helix bundle protein [Kiritimatiellales bacterium]|nr:four helix bundle protein [Kiritimatiellales bacterium]